MGTVQKYSQNSKSLDILQSPRELMYPVCTFVDASVSLGNKTSIYTTFTAVFIHSWWVENSYLFLGA